MCVCVCVQCHVPSNSTNLDQNVFPQKTFFPHLFFKHLHLTQCHVCSCVRVRICVYVCIGPNEGLLSVIYTVYPFDTEQLNLNAVKLRFPHKVPKNCKRWAAFDAVFNTNKASKTRHLVENNLDILQTGACETIVGGAADVAAEPAIVDPSIAQAQVCENKVASYIATENETPRSIAKKQGVTAEDVVALNSSRFHVPLCTSSRFKNGTLVHIPAVPRFKGSGNAPLLSISEDALVHICCGLKSHLHVSRMAGVSRYMRQCASNAGIPHIANIHLCITHMNSTHIG